MMQEQGGFVIKFSPVTNFIKIVDFVKELLSNYFPEEFDYSDSTYFKIDKNRMELDESATMDYDIFQVFFEELCKKLSVVFQDVNYRGYAHYCNLSNNYEEYRIISYSGARKRFHVTEIRGEALLECPDCGKMLINPLKFTIKDSYYCKGCETYISLDIKNDYDEFDDYEYLLIDGEFVLKK